MKNPNSESLNRRNFIRAGAVSTLGVVALSAVTSDVLSAKPLTQVVPAKEGIFMIGPMEGYSPQIGTLVSMLNYNRSTIINSVKSMSMEQLDFLLDPHANTIGALVMHLGATEKYYQANTFEGRQEMNAEEKKIWGAAMELGDEGRKNIKGNNAQYYIDMITEVREKTLKELKSKDDKWLLAIDPEWSKEESLNTYWKWFHVCEHESNHRGQIAFLKSRLPGAKPGKE
ncbi:DinB family protein [Dyadobacter arcticus]|uniref:Damage-inducible protein DinB n=1 Tax=Dyadobacter arcticus TaxID=1078754 RepID=A0ABX0ULK9_9BACT|nr:DUF664 domain-containing protein [Dyadobacter arcticus]NIJ53884.1 putative damage-inducible protein DinB [Dyadobacter arcticus]